MLTNEILMCFFFLASDVNDTHQSVKTTKNQVVVSLTIQDWEVWLSTTAIRMLIFWSFAESHS